MMANLVFYWCHKDYNYCTCTVNGTVELDDEFCHNHCTPSQCECPPLMLQSH